MAFDIGRIKSDHFIKNATYMLNKAYGEGKVYKAFEYNFHEDIFVHESKDCRRKLRYDNLQQNFILLEIIYKNAPNTKFFDDYSHNHMAPSNPNTKADWELPAIPSQKGIDENKKRNKWKSDIKTVLQKETDEWLKKRYIIKGI